MLFHLLLLQIILTKNKHEILDFYVSGIHGICNSNVDDERRIVGLLQGDRRIYAFDV